MSLSALPLASAGPINGIVPSVVVLLCWLPYRARARTLSQQRRAVPGWRQGCFAAGLITLAVALSYPVDSLADQLLLAHMAEHLVIGDISALLIVTIRAFRGHYSPEHHEGMEVPGIYWHFVDIMWVIVYTTVYIL